MVAEALAFLAMQPAPPLPDNLTGADALHRRLPSAAEAGPPKPNRYVGVFYWLWHGDDRWGPNYNVTEFLSRNPFFRDFKAKPPGGPDHPTWYWAEPLFGYYRSTDRWVMRRHLAMLADAGVDFLFFDYTNDSVYDAELDALLAEMDRREAAGGRVPQLVFFLNHNPNPKIAHLYRKYYQRPELAKRWFVWRGKPLMMAPMPASADAFANANEWRAVRSFFTFRPTWAFHDAKQEPRRWRFIANLSPDGVPERAVDENGRPEQVTISKSLGGPLWENMVNGGVSATPGFSPPRYDGQWLSGRQAEGLFHQWSWRQARAYPAPIALVTGWNEWRASVWEEPGVKFLGRVTRAGEGFFVDQFNADFNRDLEPMRGGYEDIYYLQFLGEMRRYKGMVPSPQAFTDPMGDGEARDWPASTPDPPYRRPAAENDFVGAAARMAGPRRVVTARTLRTARRHALGPWLWIDRDANSRTGMHGFDLRIESETGRIFRYANGAWTRAGTASVRARGATVAFEFPATFIGRQGWSFKFSDGVPARAARADFYDRGDSAPDGMLAYRGPSR